MKEDDLISLARRKNAAYSALLIKRQRAYMPSGTDQMKKVIMDADTVKEREAYDNLADEYAIRIMFAGRGQ